MPAPQTYRLKEIARHITSGEYCDILWLGDSQSTQSSSPRWAQGIMKTWDVDWRGRYVPNVSAISAAVEGWQTYKTLPTETAAGDLLPDGVTVCPTGLSARSVWYDADVTNFTQVQRYAHLYILTNFRGDWTLDQPLTWRLAACRMTDSLTCRIIRRRDNVSLSTVSTDFDTLHSVEAGWQPLDIEIPASSAELTPDSGGEELYLDTNGDETNKGLTFGGIGLYRTGKADGLSLSFTADGGWTTEDLRITTAELSPRFHVFGWPTLLVLQIGQNSASGESSSSGGLDTYKANVKDVLGDYDAAYVADGREPPRVMLVSNWETTKGNAFWAGVADHLQEICDERANTGLLNLFKIVNDEHGAFADWNETYLADGVHQSTDGVVEFGRLSWEALLASAIPLNPAVMGAVRQAVQRASHLASEAASST